MNLAGENPRAYIRRLSGVPPGSLTAAKLAEVGRYLLLLSAALLMLKFWSWLMERCAGRMMNQAFLRAILLRRDARVKS